MFFFFYNAGTPFVDPTARLLKLVELFKDRAPWYVARKILVAHRVSPGHGWEHTVANIKASKNHNVDIDGLTRAFVEHVSFGEKSVRFYDLGSTGVQNLRQYYRSFSNPSSLPLPLSGQDLKKSALHDPTLAYVSEDSEGLTALYSSVRKTDEREKIDVSKLPAQTRQVFDDADQLIKIKSRKTQSYDAVFIPKVGDRVEVRVDYLQNDNQDSTTAAHHNVYSDIHSRSQSRSLVSPVDLFEAIKPIYDKSSEGIVIELAFATSTGSTKHEMMRDRQKCLRQEVYHVNGKAALVTDIEPYRLGVRWVLTDGAGEIFTPELYLEGRATMVAAASPGLFTATIRKCRNSEDYALIRSKLQSYL